MSVVVNLGRCCQCTDDSIHDAVDSTRPPLTLKIGAPYDYFSDDPRTTTSSTLMNNDHGYLRNENGYFDLKWNDYFPCYDYIDYFVYFLHVTKNSFYPASNPKIPSFHTGAPKP